MLLLRPHGLVEEPECLLQRLALRISCLLAVQQSLDLLLFALQLGCALANCGHALSEQAVVRLACGPEVVMVVRAARGDPALVRGAGSTLVEPVASVALAAALVH